MLKLIIEDDEGRKTVVPFVRDEITIGRQEGNTIRLTERNVSRRHARLLRQNGHVMVEDLGSYNGIKINGDKISGQVKVNEGDLIQIGDYDLAVQRDEAQPTPPMLPTPSPQEDTARTQPRAPMLRPAAVSAPAPAAATAVTTQKLPDTAATVPVLPSVDELNEAEEAHPDDVRPAPEETPARRETTAVIRVDQVEHRVKQSEAIDPADAPKLVALTTDLAGKEFLCTRTELRLGRTDENDIVIDHRSLSRTHCKLVRGESGEWKVVDLQSANGLLVNGEQYAQCALKFGDVIELGHVKLKFVSASESVDISATTRRARAVSAPSKLPAVVLVTVMLLALAAAAVYWFKVRPAVEEPSKVVDLPPRHVEQPLPPPQPSAVDVDAKVKEILASAKNAIEALEWKKAEELLKSCRVGDSLCPEAQRLLTELASEKELKLALDKAETALDADKLQEAKDQLSAAEHTKLLTKRLASLQQRFKEATAKKLAQPPEPPKEVKRPVPPNPQAQRAAELSKLLEDARASLKANNANQAKATLERCVKLDTGNADCHMLLGTTYAKLGSSEKGLYHYRKFVELAPDHPQAARVKKFIEAYEGK